MSKRDKSEKKHKKSDKQIEVEENEHVDVEQHVI